MGGGRRVRLVVDLQEGFGDQPVAVEVDGSRVAELDRVASNPMTGFAETVELTVAEGRRRLVVTVGPGLSGERTVELGGDTWVGVSVSGGALHFVERDQPFGYS